MVLRDRFYMAFYPSRVEKLVHWAYEQGRSMTLQVEQEKRSHDGYLAGLKAGREQALRDFSSILREVDQRID